MIESPSATPTNQVSLLDQVNTSLERWGRTSVGRLWARHHPSWVLLRGWFLLIAWSHIYTGLAFSVFPIPNATAMPFAWSGSLILFATTAISWAIAGVARTVGGRVLDAGLTVLVIYTMFAAAINS